MEALGRLFNVVPTAAGEQISLANASGVTFVCVGADTFTVQEATDAAGTGARSLAALDHYYANANADGSTAWTRTAVDPVGAAITIAAGIAAVHVPAAAVSDGYDFVSCDGAATGLVVAITHDLFEQRDPTLLAALGV